MCQSFVGLHLLQIKVMQKMRATAYARWVALHGYRKEQLTSRLARHRIHHHRHHPQHPTHHKLQIHHRQQQLHPHQQQQQEGEEDEEQLRDPQLDDQHNEDLQLRSADISAAMDNGSGNKIGDTVAGSHAHNQPHQLLGDTGSIRIRDLSTSSNSGGGPLSISDSTAGYDGHWGLGGLVPAAKQAVPGAYADATLAVRARAAAGAGGKPAADVGGKGSVLAGRISSNTSGDRDAVAACQVQMATVEYMAFVQGMRRVFNRVLAVARCVAEAQDVV